MKKIKILLSCLLCLVFVAASGLVGCNGYTYKKTELSHYSYAESERTGDYNTKLFYRNDYDVPLGDPTLFMWTRGLGRGISILPGLTAAALLKFIKAPIL